MMSQHSLAVMIMASSTGKHFGFSPDLSLWIKTPVYQVLDVLSFEPH